MHAIVSWDIPASANRTEQEATLVSCFQNRLYNRPLTTFYIVRVSSLDDHQALLNALQTAGRLILGIRLLVSPAMSGGVYDGLHEATTWQQLNQISSQ